MKCGYPTKLYLFIGAGLVAGSAQASMYFNPGLSYQKLDITNSVATSSNTSITKTYLYSAEFGVESGRTTIGVRGDYASQAVSAGSATATLSQLSATAILGLRFGSAIQVRPIAGIGYLVKNSVTYVGTSNDGTYAKPGIMGLGGAEISLFIDSKHSMGLTVEGGYRFVVPTSLDNGAATVGAITSGLYGRGGVCIRF